MSKVKVPTVDLEKAKDDPSQLKSLDKACRDHGFFLLKNHGMQEEIDDMWRMSESVSYTHLTLPTILLV